jgi:hypothetical protein
MQRLQDKQIYQSHYWVTCFTHKNRDTVGNGVIYGGPNRDVITETRLEVSSGSVISSQSESQSVTTGLDWIRHSEWNVCWTEWFLWTSLYVVCSRPTSVWKKRYWWSLQSSHVCAQCRAKQQNKQLTWLYTKMVDVAVPGLRKYWT